MALENTELERRVLAHEQILQALMAQLAHADPSFLDRMSEQFSGSGRAAYEYERIETADYAEAFLREVRRIRDRPSTGAAKRVEQSLSRPTPAPSQAPHPVMIRVARRSGVWHVTKDGVFLGDYIAEDPALNAANGAADVVEKRGGAAEIVITRQ